MTTPFTVSNNTLHVTIKGITYPVLRTMSIAEVCALYPHYYDLSMHIMDVMAEEFDTPAFRDQANMLITDDNPVTQYTLELMSALDVAIEYKERANIVYALQDIMGTVMEALMPMFIEMEGEEIADMPELERIVNVYSKYVIRYGARKALNRMGIL